MTYVVRQLMLHPFDSLGNLSHFLFDEFKLFSELMYVHIRHCFRNN
jgi:hypothetical protein